MRGKHVYTICSRSFFYREKEKNGAARGEYEVKFFCQREK